MDIQTNLSDDSLVMAICANLCEFFHHLGRSSPETLFESGSFIRWDSPIQHPWFNGVLSSHMPEETDTGFIDETLQYFRSKNKQSCTWWVAPHLKPQNWQAMLSAFNFHFSSDTPGMAADLQVLNEITQTVDGLEVHVVADEEALRTWARVFTAGYGLPMEWETLVYEQWAKLGLGFPLRNYLGYLNGKPVATSCLFMGGGAAGIYSVSTLPEARSKGIGAAMTLRPLHNARELGFHIGVLQSSDMGYTIYKKLGFKHLCQIEYFYRSLT